MRIARFVAVGALAVAATDTSATPAQAKRAAHNGSPKHTPAPKSDSSTPFRVATWASLDDQNSTSRFSERRLNLDVVSNDVEEITVYGKRLKRTERGLADNNSQIRLGSATVTGTTHSDQADFSGLKVTAAVPISGIPGLDAVMNVSGGYDQVNASTTTSSAAATVGLRLRF